MPAMAMELKVDTDADEVGFDGSRLERIDRHFARYVDEGQLPGWLIVVTRRGKVAHLSRYGYADIEAGRPVEVDTLWRIFSMTKPITSVAAMMLFEECAFDLTDPIARWLPEFAEPRVYVKGSALNPLTEPATEPIRLWHLLTHTSGMTYGFHHAHPVDAMYRAGGFEWGTPPGLDLAGASSNGRSCHWCSSRAANGTIRSLQTCSAGWWKSCPGSRLMSSSGSGSSPRSA